MLEKINNMLKMFGSKIQEEAAQKITKPGDPFSPFKVENGMVGFKPYIIAENQNEAVLYPHNCTAVDVRPEVELWLLNQPPHLWKYAEQIEGCHHGMARFLVNAELLSWMTLRWA
jgi:hypothetical protein